jgi:aminobenzoyl-glutamate utilization protein B
MSAPYRLSIRWNPASLAGWPRVAVLALLALVGCQALASEQEKDVSKEKQTVLDWLGRPATVEKFGRISDAVWSYAELGLQEHKSSALLIKTVEEAGFTVEKGLAGMPTCFVATYGSGKPVIGILVEYDALPMLSQKGRVPTHDPVVAGAPGHGCGHNLMASAATAAAIAVKQAIEKHELTGTIKLFGSPAEEILVSRPFMVRAGLFEGVDAVINNHTSSGFSTDYGVAGSAMYSVVFSFQGKTAHSGSTPWSGRSALDAVEIMNVATNFLREHLHFSARMHYVIPGGGEAPNVVPDRARVWYFLRSSDANLRDMFDRVVNCAKGAAMATGTELAEVRVLAGAHQSHHNKALAEMMMKNIELVGMPEWSEEDHEFARALQKELGRTETGMPAKVGSLGKPATVFVGGASSDHGDVTLIAPTATIRFPGNVPGALGHHWSTVAAGFGPGAWKGVNAGAKAMAASAIDLLTEPESLAAVRQEFAEYSKKHPFKSFLPDDAEPPLTFYDDLMKQYRPAMEAFYLDVEPDANQ